ncbi:TlpA family protein disulfide reductase [Sporolactobacillus sp. KGMB 08714]|uniref:TlpA family protein disulfide reductase n=1 Tax=Sporolactobacillus sp. KGMB 08714 TaxID=3064704 RepID=UPI002FBE002A
MIKNLILPELDTATHWINQKAVRNDLLGKPSLIHFWSIGCHYCKQSMPLLNTIRDRYVGLLHVVAVHMPLSEEELNVAEVAETCTLYRISHPVLIDNTHRLADSFDNRYVPAYYLFDKEGRLLKARFGEFGALRMSRTIDYLFQRNPE